MALSADSPWQHCFSFLFADVGVLPAAAVSLVEQVIWSEAWSAEMALLASAALVLLAQTLTGVACQGPCEGGLYLGCDHDLYPCCGLCHLCGSAASFFLGLGHGPWSPPVCHRDGLSHEIALYVGWDPGLSGHARCGSAQGVSDVYLVIYASLMAYVFLVGQPCHGLHHEKSDQVDCPAGHECDCCPSAFGYLSAERNHSVHAYIL